MDLDLRKYLWFWAQRQKWMNGTISNSKPSAQQKKLQTKLKGKQLNGRRYLQTTVLTRGNIQNIKRTPTTQHQTNNPILKNGQRTCTDTSPKKTYKQPTEIWKDVQLHKLLGKCKSKLQWDTTSLLIEWLLSTRQVITNDGEFVEEKEP